MSCYKELKEYDNELTQWHKTKSLAPTNKTKVRVNDIIAIYNKYMNTNYNCSSCSAKYLTNISKWYMKQKEHYKARRKGKNETK